MEGSELQLHRTVAYVDQYSKPCFSQWKASLLRCAVQPPCCAAMLAGNLQGSLPWLCILRAWHALLPLLLSYPKGAEPSMRHTHIRLPLAALPTDHHIPQLTVLETCQVRGVPEVRASWLGCLFTRACLLRLPPKSALS